MYIYHIYILQMPAQAPKSSQVGRREGGRVWQLRCLDETRWDVRGHR